MLADLDARHPGRDGTELTADSLRGVGLHVQRIAMAQPTGQKTRIIDLACGLVPAVAPLGFAAATPSARARPARRSARPKPRKPQKPTWRNSRRIISAGWETHNVIGF